MKCVISFKLQTQHPGDVLAIVTDQVANQIVNQMEDKTRKNIEIYDEHQVIVFYCPDKTDVLAVVDYVD